MFTFLIGLVILLSGYFLYSTIVTKKLNPKADKKTCAYYAYDSSDYVPLSSFRTRMIQALSIIGTGPIFGPILGAYFGPIVLILIPIGNIIGGSICDYIIGWASLRNKGRQLSFLSQKFLGEKLGKVILIFIAFLLLLVSSVFVYTPIDVAGSYIDFSNKMWLMYLLLAIIFLYYFLNTIFPIHKIIGKIYPILGTLFIISAFALFVGAMSKGYLWSRDTLFPQEIWHSGSWNFYATKVTSDGNILLNADKLKPIVPVLFITIACGILSGFHATQSPMVARCLNKETDARKVFYGMMTFEGLIAMIWASLGIAVLSNQALLNNFVHQTNGNLISPGLFVVKINETILGKAGGMIGVMCLLLLPLTSGETGFRALRLTLADNFHIDQKKYKNKILLALPCFAVGIAIVIFAKTSANGFYILWSYFGWLNITTAVIAFAIATVYLYSKKSKSWLFTFIPFNIWMFFSYAYIIFNPFPVEGKEVWQGNEDLALILALSIGFVLTILTSILLIYHARKVQSIEKEYVPSNAELSQAEKVEMHESYMSRLLLKFKERWRKTKKAPEK